MTQQKDELRFYNLLHKYIGVVDDTEDTFNELQGNIQKTLQRLMLVRNSFQMYNLRYYGTICNFNLQVSASKLPIKTPTLRNNTCIGKWRTKESLQSSFEHPSIVFQFDTDMRKKPTIITTANQANGNYHK